MKVFGPNIKKVCDEYRNCVVCLGFFDGVHLGHAQLINAAIHNAKEKNVKSMVYTFDISPRNFGNAVKVLEITPLNLKAEVLATFDIDAIYVDRFNEEMKSLSAREFIEKIIIQKLGASHLIVGYNYRFGKDAMCGAEELKAFCKDYGIGVTVMEPFYLDGTPVSSTFIRSLLSEGRVDEAAKFLGRYFFIVNKVIKGQQIGSVLDVKTINQEFIKNTIVPARGVYISRTTIDGMVYKSITNVGTRPTVNNGNDIRVETHIIEFNSDIYGKNVKVEFLKRIRDEKRFQSLEALKLQLSADTHSALEFFEKNFV